MTNPIIVVPGSNDFVPHPSDAAPTGQSGGNPHFETFNGEAFSYHGECDLVMMKSPSFASGLGLYVHIRTTRIDNARSYSYISAAAVRIGKNDVLETKDDGSILINGLPLAEEDGTFAGFPVIKTIKGSNKQIFVYDLMMLGEDDKSIQIRANLKTGMLFLDMIGNFEDSVGLMGRAGTTRGYLLARDGVTNLAGEYNTFGEEWQVDSNEPKLFAENRAPQHPAGCLYQSQHQQTKAHLRRRRLMDDSMNAVMTIELATKACENLVGRKQDFCISDVMATGDLELAEDPFYG